MYLKTGQAKKAAELASELPHKRECREVILPLMGQALGKEEIDRNIKTLILGE